jgi:hypothetical protein
VFVALNYYIVPNRCYIEARSYDVGVNKLKIVAIYSDVVVRKYDVVARKYDVVARKYDVVARKYDVVAKWSDHLHSPLLSPQKNKLTYLR